MRIEKITKNAPLSPSANGPLVCISKLFFFHFAFGAVDALALDFTRYVFSALYGIILRFSSSMIHELDISVSKKPEV